MFNNEGRHPIKEEWIDYYRTLEGIRVSGITNMFGAASYLKEFCPELSHDEAKEILLSWMENYHELNKRFGWQ
jgi:hypothetical protein